MPLLSKDNDNSTAKNKITKRLNALIIEGKGNSMNQEIEFAIKEVNKERKANKNKWFTLFVTISGEQVAIKGYNTWIQRLKTSKNDCVLSSNMDLSVKGFNGFLQESFLSIQSK